MNLPVKNLGNGLRLKGNGRGKKGNGGRKRVLIVDDSQRFRHEMASLLAKERDVEVVGMARDGLEAVEMATRLQPDIILMDEKMPALTGIEATVRIRENRLPAQIFFVVGDPAYRTQAMRAGADQYFLKGTQVNDLLHTIRAVARGTAPAREWPAPDKAAERAANGRQWGVMIVTTLLLLALLVGLWEVPGAVLPTLGLALGGLFFLYALKYYASVGLILFASASNGNGNGNGHNGNGKRRNGYRNGNGRGLANGNGHRNGRGLNGHTNGNGLKPVLARRPFISIHLPMYNEKLVVDRLLTACTSLDYEDYEVIVADDSTDDTTEILRQRWGSHPRVKISHRRTRRGFKGGALQEALKQTDSRAEYIVVFDADFIPPPGILDQFLAYFYGTNGDNGGEAAHGQGNGEAVLLDERVAVVQGYQWHVLNASENWITRAIRSEYSGSYVVERGTQELVGALKMVSGSVFMIRADVLRRLGWRTSITEDWELTLRLYLEGFKVLYTPFVQAPAECVSGLRQLIRQRMRWAEGHTYNVKKYFWRVMSSQQLTWREKLEFLYYVPYYLQAALFMVGTTAWLLSELVFHQHLPFWSDMLGWSLLFTNVFSLGLMNLSGLFLERGVRRGWLGLLSFLLLTYLLVPYQAYASLKGLLEPHEGGWHRTQKTGVITEVIERLGHVRRLSPLKPKKKRRSIDLGKRLGIPAAVMDRLPRPLRNLSGRTIFAFRLAGGLLTGLLLLGILASQVPIVSAAPDVFYLRDTTTNGVASPAGQDINLLQGSSENTLTFDSVDDEAYWYTDVAYPTGSGDASIAAGSYTLNLYFSQLPQLPADWYNANWHCRKKITIDSGLVSADLSDFPVLISLASDADLAADAQDDGDDILFTSSDGTTQLSHEIETFDGGTGELVAWVQADLSGSTDTEIYMYYGNGTVSSQQDITGVWDGGFEGVWHIDETSGAHYDSTSNGNSSTSVDVATQGSATGQIDGADDFNGSSNDIVIADSASLDITSAITIEAWIEDDLTGKRRIVAKGDEVYVLRSDYTGRLQAYVAKGGTLYYARSLDGLIDTNGYHYVVLTWDGVTGDHSLRLYHDGSEISDYATQDSVTSPLDTSATDLMIGSHGTGEYWDGRIDEVRISSVARTAQWIETCYHNQSSPGTFIKSLGTEEALPSVDIIVRVYHTRSDGSDPQQIVTSSTVTINATTADPYGLNIGSGTEQTFLSSDPRRVRVHVDVTAVNGGGSFAVAYDSASNPSSLDTPSMVVFEGTLLLVAVVIFIPIVIDLFMRKRRLMVRLAVMGLSFIGVLAILGQQLLTAVAAPDVFYLRDTTTNGVASPAGEDMNITQGSSEDTLVFDGVDDEAYWYTDVAYPTGSDDASIGAGNYTAHLYFDALPDASSWWNTAYDYRQNVTLTAGSAAVPSGYTVSITFNHAALVSAGKSQADGDDIRLTYWNGSGWTELDRFLDPGSSWNGATTRIWFKTQAGIAASGSSNAYDVYYGNPSAASPPANPDSVFFHYDGFESGDLSAWDGAWTGTGDSLTVTGSTVRTGSYSAEAYVDAGTQAAAYYAFTAISGLHTTVYLYLPSGFSDADYTAFAQYRGELGSNIASMTVYGDDPPGANNMKPYIYNTPGGEFYFSDTALTTGAWHRLEMRFLVAGTSGRAELWVDGVRKVYQTGIDTGTEDITSSFAGIYWRDSGEVTLYVDDTFDRLWVDPEPTVALGSEAREPSVDITVSVYHTAADGSDPQLIVTSATTTITSATSDPLDVSLGSGAQQTFTQADPRRVRMRITVGSVNSGGSFTLAYDSSANSSSLDTPVVTVPEWNVAFLALVPLIPLLMSLFWRRRRLAGQLISLALACSIALGLLSTNVPTAGADPDTFYLHNTSTTGITPAGRYKNTTLGTGGSTLAFDTAAQDAYWYVDQTWPTGGGDGGIAAGSYTLNMYFSELPRPWWNANYAYRQRITVTNNDSVQLAANTIAGFTTNTQSLVSGGKLRSDGKDWRVMYWNGSSWSEIAQLVEGGWNTTSTETWFRLQAAINASASDSNYYIYYGYSGETTSPSTFTTSEADLAHQTSGGGNASCEAHDFDSVEYGGAQTFSISAGSPTYYQITRFQFYVSGKCSGCSTWGDVAGFIFNTTGVPEETSGSPNYITNGKSGLLNVGTDISANAWGTFTWSGSKPRIRSGTTYYIAILPTNAAGRYASTGYFRWDVDRSLTGGYQIHRSGTWDTTTFLNDCGDGSVARTYRVYGREAANANLSSSLGTEASSANVQITVTVSHTASDGSGATTIVSSSTTTINSSTANPYALSIGSGAQQTFTSGSPRRLRVQVNVSAINGAERFVLGYDGSCASTRCSNLDTPVVTVPEHAIAWVAPVVLIPIMTGGLRAWKVRRKMRGTPEKSGD